MQSDGKEGPGVGIMRGMKGEGRELEGCINKGFPCFPGGSDCRASACNAGDSGSILGREEPQEKEMTSQSSTLAWKIPWMEEPGGLVHGVAKSRT